MRSPRHLSQTEGVNHMSEIFDSTAQEPGAESSGKTSCVFGTRAKEKLLTQVRQEPVKTLLIVLAGSILTSFLLGYCVSRLEEGSQAAALDRRLDAGNNELDPRARPNDRCSNQRRPQSDQIRR